MNRSALVIKMLNYLYANGRNKPVSREELASFLETNPRNILEFKKEIETAGYLIESVRGKEGGYMLKEDGIFPSLALSEEEKQAIDQVLTYLKKQSNFEALTIFEEAMYKCKAKQFHLAKENRTIYLEESRKRLNEHENQMLKNIQYAKNIQKEITCLYVKGNSKDFEKRILRPYEIIVNAEGFYVLAEDLTPKKMHKIKLFKITEERMQEVVITNKNFSRDPEFKVSKYIGEYALMKDAYEVKLKISGLSARLVNEQEIENTIEKYWSEEALIIRFVMEGKYRLKNFILSLGSDCEVLEPASLKEEIIEELNTSLELYKKSTL